jgi:aspartate kinase
MLNAQGFLARIFQTLAEHRLSVDLVTTSEVSVSLTVDGTSLGSSGRSIMENHKLLDELRSFSDVSVEEDLSLVALIGNRLTYTAGVGARAFRAVEPSNVRLLCHGASQHNLCFLVKSADAESAARSLHKEFL